MINMNRIEKIKDLIGQVITEVQLFIYEIKTKFYKFVAEIYETIYDNKKYKMPTKRSEPFTLLKGAIKGIYIGIQDAREEYKLEKQYATLRKEQDE